jgi:hypothetical protein
MSIWRSFSDSFTQKLRVYRFWTNHEVIEAIGPQIWPHHPRKPLVPCFLCAHKVLLNSSFILPNADIWLVSHICMLLAGGGTTLFGKKVTVELLLEERRIPVKFDFICSYGVQMRNEQTDKYSSLHIWVAPWGLYHFCGKTFFFNLDNLARRIVVENGLT